jgi:hypothetical protein
MSDNRPVRYVEDDGTIVYRASGLGLCDRIYVALDHIDGRVVGGDQPEMDALWEGKKVRPSGWDAFKRKGVEWHKNYPMQVSVYMHALGLERLFFTGGLYDPDKQEILETYTHAYHDPPINKLAIRKRIAKLEGLVNSGKHTMDVSCPSTPDYPCPFYYLHDDDAGEPKERPSDDIVAPLVTTMETLKAEKTPLAKRIKEIDAEIKNMKGGIEGWWEASGLEPGEECKVKIGDDEFVIKVNEVARKGYTVEPTGYTTVSIKASKEKK